MSELVNSAEMSLTHWLACLLLITPVIYAK